MKILDQNALVKTFLIPKGILKQAAPIIEPPTEKIVLPAGPAVMADHISNTQLMMYLRCSMQYYFRYVEHLREKPKVSLSIGKGGHAALEWNAKRKIVTGEDQPVEAVIQKASDSMDFYMSEMPPSEYEKDVEPGALKDKQLAATRVFRVRDAPKIIPIGAEIEHNLDINQYLDKRTLDIIQVRPINLKIDTLYQDYETRVVDSNDRVAIGVEDYKYATRKKSQAEVDLSPQLSLYTLAVKDITGKWPTKTGIRVMHPGSLAAKPRADSDGPDSIKMLRSPEHMTPVALEARMRRIAYQFAQAERGIREAIYIPVDEPQTCGWCGYRDRCQGTSTTDFDAARIRERTAPPPNLE